MIDQLISTINKEASLFEAFLTLLERQQEALAANDVEQLDSLTASLREKLVESQLLNRQREQLVHDIKVANSIDGDLNVSRLLELVDESQAGRLRDLRQTIMGLHDKITETRNTNAMVLNKSREYIVRMMDMLSRVNNPSQNYTGGHAAPVNANAVAVDRRA